MRFRTIEFNCSGSTSYTYSNDYDELSGHLYDGVDAGRLTGGGIQQYVDGIGWVVCN